MSRWLLNTFATWELGVLIIGAFVALAVAGLLLFRRFAPHLQEGESNDVAGVILGVLAAIYGIVLAFVIVSLYDDYRQANADIRTEATALATVYRDSRGFPAPVRNAVERDIGLYIETATGPEWKSLAHGRESALAWKRLDRLYSVFEHYEPKTQSEQVYYSEIVGRLNDLIGDRRERLNDAEQGIPPTFEILLVGGAVLVLGFTFLFGVRSSRLHAAMTVAVAVLLGFNLLVALVLEYPYSGEVTVSRAPYGTGNLQVFAHDDTQP